MYDIVLMSPASRMINHYRPPLALMYVANWYRSQDHKVKIIDVPMKEVVRNKKFWANRDAYINQIHLEMMKQLSEVSTRWVGISAYSTEISEVKKMVYEIREYDEQIKIVVGGIGPTLSPEDFSWADSVIRGRLDVVGPPAYDLVDMKYYTKVNPYAIRGVFIKATYVLSSMGCPSNCSFCVAPRLREFYEVGYIKYPCQLAAEINLLKEDYHIDGFYIIDDLFTLKKDYVKDFCSRIKNEGLLWGCQSRITTIDEETIKIMAESGCIQMDFGVERGSNEELKRLKKGQTIEKTKEIFALCRHYGIRTLANYLVNIPGESPRDFKDIRENIRQINPNITNINTFQGYCGCELPDQRPKESVKRWVKVATKRYNSLIQQLDKTLWKRIWKLNYLKQLWELIREIINQKM